MDDLTDLRLRIHKAIGEERWQEADDPSKILLARDGSSYSANVWRAEVVAALEGTSAAKELAATALTRGFCCHRCAVSVARILAAEPLSAEHLDADAAATLLDASDGGFRRDRQRLTTVQAADRVLRFLAEAEDADGSLTPEAKVFRVLALIARGDLTSAWERLTVLPDALLDTTASAYDVGVMKGLLSFRMGRDDHLAILRRRANSTSSLTAIFMMVIVECFEAEDWDRLLKESATELTAGNSFERHARALALAMSRRGRDAEQLITAMGGRPSCSLEAIARAAALADSAPDQAASYLLLARTWDYTGDAANPLGLAVGDMVVAALAPKAKTIKQAQMMQSISGLRAAARGTSNGVAEADTTRAMPQTGTASPTTGLASRTPKTSGVVANPKPRPIPRPPGVKAAPPSPPARRSRPRSTAGRRLEKRIPLAASALLALPGLVLGPIWLILPVAAWLAVNFPKPSGTVGPATVLLAPFTLLRQLLGLLYPPRLLKILLGLVLAVILSALLCAAAAATWAIFTWSFGTLSSAVLLSLSADFVRVLTWTSALIMLRATALTSRVRKRSTSLSTSWPESLVALVVVGAVVSVPVVAAGVAPRGPTSGPTAERALRLLPDGPSAAVSRQMNVATLASADRIVECLHRRGVGKQLKVGGVSTAGPGEETVTVQVTRRGRDLAAADLSVRSQVVGLALNNGLAPWVRRIATPAHILDRWNRPNPHPTSSFATSDWDSEPTASQTPLIPLDAATRDAILVCSQPW